MIGETFELGHQRPQPVRAGRYLHPEGRLDGASKRDGIGNRAVAG